MDTHIRNPIDLFNQTIQYVIPAFQRRYVWNQEEQWEPLWDDVSGIAEGLLESQSGSGANIAANSPPHFMGAVVVHEIQTGFGQMRRYNVIDGQQRMTTIQLLLDAVQSVFGELNLNQAGFLSQLVTNSGIEVLDENKDVFKLWPTTWDEQAFRHAMDNGLAVDEFTDSLIVQAHEYFQLRTKEWLLETETNLERRAEALYSAVVGLLQLVVIDLNANEDPYIIFETLNARGTPLLESDLIKNFVMSNVRDAKIWGDLDDDWWSEEITQGRLTRPRKEALFNYWLAMRRAPEVPANRALVAANRVFAEFRRQAEQPNSVEGLMKDVNRDLGNYRRFMFGERTPDEDKFHYRVNEVMEIRAITPVFLLLLSAPDEARRKSLKILESFLVRGMLCRGGGSQGSNLLSHELARELQRDRLDNADKVVRDFLRRQTAYNRQWPDDRELESRLDDRTVYRVITRRRLRMILEAVEERLRENPLSEHSDVPKGLTIEHVMPQNWLANWPLPEGADEQDAAERRNWLIHTIGNLTLVNRRLNPALSNAAWDEKRDTLRKHSVLLMNDRLLQESEGVAWDEHFIQARSRRMAKIIAEVWPGPNSPAWDE